MLIISGPVSAVTVDLVLTEPSTGTVTQGGSVNFTVSITINTPDKFVPIENFSLSLTGPTLKQWFFTPAGVVVPQEDPGNITIDPVSTPQPSDFGYGYGYAVDNSGYGYGYGVPYDFSGGYGYKGYGYGYNYGAGGGSLTYRYNITLNTANLTAGNYTARVSLNTGSSIKPSFTSGPVSFTVEAPTTTPTPTPTPTPGVLRGFVTTASGVGVPSVMVTASNATSNKTTFTGFDGSYAMSLSPANYSLNFSKSGYEDNTSLSVLITSNNISTVNAILYSVSLSAARTIVRAENGTNASFAVSISNTGTDATFNLTNNTVENVTFYINNTHILVNGSETKTLEVNASSQVPGAHSLVITASDTSTGKSASLRLFAIFYNASAENTTIGNTVINNSNVTEGAIVIDSTVNSSNVTGAALINATVTNGSIVTGDAFVNHSTVNASTIVNATIQANSILDRSTVVNATVISSNLTGTNVTGGALLSNVSAVNSVINGSVELEDIVLLGVTVTRNESTGQPVLESGSVVYQGINFTNVYRPVPLQELVKKKAEHVVNGIVEIDNSTDISALLNVSSNRTVSLILSRTGINPDGEDKSDTLGDFVHILANDTGNITNVTIRLYYTTSSFDSNFIYFYNTTTGDWEKLDTTGSGTHAGFNYTEAQPDHLSTFVLAGVSAPSQPSGGGHGGGGAGVRTPTVPSNIEIMEQRELTLYKDRETVYRFRNASLVVYEMAVVPRVNAGDTTARVEQLKGISRLVNLTPQGRVYKYVNVWLGTTGFATPKNLKQIKIRFRVKTKWLSDNSLERGSVRLLKWTSNQWQELSTSQIREDSSYVYYEAVTDSLSPLAVVAIPGAVVTPTPVLTPAPTGPEVTPTPTPTAVPGKGISTATWLAAVVVVLAVVIVGYLLWRKKAGK